MVMTAQEFRTIRDKLNLTQAALAPMIGYRGKNGKSKVSNIETGCRPCPWHIARLMRCYAVIAAGMGREFIPTDE